MASSSSEDKPVEAKALFQLLTRNGGKAGWNAYVKLCGQMGCEQRIVGTALMYLQPESSFTLRSTPEERIQRYREIGKGNITEGFIEREMERGVEELEIDLRPMDSQEAALDDFTSRKLEALQRNCRKLAKEIEALHATRLVRFGMIDGEFPHSYPFQVPAQLKGYADDFIPIIQEKAKHIGPRQRPDYTRLLTAMFRHIREKTDGWQDKLVAVMLNDLFAYDTENLQTAGSLKQWRFDHGLVDTPKTS